VKLLKTYRKNLETAQKKLGYTLKHNFYEGLEELEKQLKTLNTAETLKLLIELQHAISEQNTQETRVLCRELLDAIEYLYTCSTLQNKANTDVVERAELAHTRSLHTYRKKLAKQPDETRTFTNNDLHFLYKHVLELCNKTGKETEIRKYYNLLRSEKILLHGQTEVGKENQAKLVVKRRDKEESRTEILDIDLEILSTRLEPEPEKTFLSIIPGGLYDKNCDLEEVHTGVLNREPELLENALKLYTRTQLTFKACIEVTERL